MEGSGSVHSLTRTASDYCSLLNILNDKKELYIIKLLVSNLEKQQVNNIDVIEKSIGVFGKWHLFICLVIYLVKFPVAFHQLSIVFIAPPSEFTCVDHKTEKCSVDCETHIFDRSVFTNTIITEWDLVCDKAYLANLAQTITMTGILIGNMFFGYLSDRYGRRRPFISAVILQLFSGCALAFAPWLPLFFVLRFLCGCATGGTMVTSFVYIMELVGKKWRTTLGILYQIPFNLGHILLPLIGYYVRDWRMYQLSISLPSILYISYYWILPESPRWLLIMGKKERAVTIMNKIAAYNKMETQNIENDVEQYLEKNQEPNIKHKNKGGNILDLFKTPVMRMYTLLMWYCWFVTGFCFFGVAQFSGQLAGDIFINITISAILQSPGSLICIWTLEKWGRRWTLFASSLLGGCSSLVIIVVPTDPTWLKAIFSCLGQVSLIIAFSTIYIYAGELFPTPVRNVGIGSSSMSARIGSIVAPFIVGLVNVKEWLPPAIFGAVAISGAILSLKLPETSNCQLPDTIEEAENFVKNVRSSNKTIM